MNKRELSTYYNQVKSELDEKLKLAQEQLHQIDNIVNETRDRDENSQNAIESIHALQEDANNRVENIKEQQEKLSKIQAQALDEESGIEAIQFSVESILKQTKELSEEVQQQRDRARDLAENVDDIETDAKEKQKNINTINSEAKEIREKIEETYKLATNTGLAGTLQSRKNEIEKDKNFWRILFIIFACAAVVITLIVIGIIFRQETTTLLEVFYRALFITPFIIIAAIFFRQFSKERDMLEQYSFKFAMAHSLENYSQLLLREFDQKYKGKERVGYTNKILNFTIEAMRDIYTEPRFDNVKRSARFSFSGSKVDLEEAIEKEVDKKISKYKEDEATATEDRNPNESEETS